MQNSAQFKRGKGPGGGDGGEKWQRGQQVRERVGMPNPRQGRARVQPPAAGYLFAQILHRRGSDPSFAQSLHTDDFAHYLHSFFYPNLPTNAAIVLILPPCQRIPVSAPV